MGDRMQGNQVHSDEDEIDIKEVFRTIFEYKYMIVLFVLLFGLGSAYYAYFKDNVYKASVTIEVGVKERGFGSQDILTMAMDQGSKNTDTEMEIIKSRFLAERVAQEVDFSHKYYTTRKFKEIELYKNSPFEVGMNKGYEISFNLLPIDDKHYRLIVEETEDKSGKLWSYDQKLAYEKEIVTKHFHLNVRKTKATSDEAYRFMIIDPADIGHVIQKGVKVAASSKFSDILTISFEDNVALRAQEAANALSEAYIKQSIEKKNQEAKRTLDFVDKQLKLITENLKGSAIKLEEFKKNSNTVNLSAKAENIIRQMSDAEGKLAEISIQEEMLSGLYKQVKSGKGLESITVGGSDMEKTALPTMIQKLQDAIIKKKILREDYTEMYPDVRKLRKTISQLKSVIVSTIKNLTANIKERKALLEKSIAKQQKQLNTLPADERMFGQLQRKFAVNEKIYSYLLEKRSETAIIKASTVSKNRIIDSALMPEDPIKPKRKLIVLVGLILGLIVGIALAFLRAFLDDRIKSEEDITKITQDIPLLGTIPHIKEFSDKVMVFLSPKSAVAESYRNLRTNLQFMTNYSKAHVIAITSTVGGEGKTTNCINLAGIMSMAGKKTIILNLDMRKPTLHEKFDLKNVQGMSSLLSGNVHLASIIQQTAHENLDIISSGPIPPNPSELIQSEFMPLILEKLKEIYDVIILDTPPIGLVTDARTLMHFADTSIYVVRANHSKKVFLKTIVQLAKQKEIKGMGILFNDVTIGKYGYGYGYGYGYYDEDN
jgi:capsular exopolysaccharide synthesis family protein